MKKVLQWVKSMLSDECGAISSKRVVGVLGSLCLFTALFIADNNVSPVLVQTVGVLCGAALGLTSLDKWAKSKANEQGTSDKESS